MPSSLFVLSFAIGMLFLTLVNFNGYIDIPKQFIVSFSFAAFFFNVSYLSYDFHDAMVGLFEGKKFKERLPLIVSSTCMLFAVASILILPFALNPERDFDKLISSTTLGAMGLLLMVNVFKELSLEIKDFKARAQSENEDSDN